MRMLPLRFDISAHSLKIGLQSAWIYFSYHSLVCVTHVYRICPTFVQFVGIRRPHVVRSRFYAEQVSEKR